MLLYISEKCQSIEVAVEEENVEVGSSLTNTKQFHNDTHIIFVPGLKKFVGRYEPPRFSNVVSPRAGI